MKSSMRSMSGIGRSMSIMGSMGRSMRSMTCMRSSSQPGLWVLAHLAARYPPSRLDPLAQLRFLAPVGYLLTGR